MYTKENRKVCKTYNEASRYTDVLSQDDDGWSYKIMELREGGYVIAIYNENDDFIGYWS